MSFEERYAQVRERRLMIELGQLLDELIYTLEWIQNRIQRMQVQDMEYKRQRELLRAKR